jgi:7,8-dihydropterin-6-yl-methyl-4-(beta-D-ribofuranosyl)aminobenzene 5'-phosphate synthase
MKISVLVENTAISGGFGCEHGLSLYIETEKHKLLFDMGMSGLFG